MRVVKKLVRALIKTIAIVALLLILLFWLFTLPGQVEQRNLASNDVVSSQNLLSSSIRQLKSDSADLTITLTQANLDAMFNVASHTLKPFVFHGSIFDSGVVVHLVYALPGIFSERLIPLTCFFNETTQGFRVEDCKLGRVTIPSRFAHFLFESSIHALLDSPSDQQILQLISMGQVANQQVSFSRKPSQPINVELNPKLYAEQGLQSSLFSANKNPAPDIQVYLDELSRLYQSNQNERRLAFYMQHLFKFALHRADNAAVEQQYINALWALAVGLGNKRFARYANTSLTPDQVPQLPRVTLSGRGDLPLHFLYSAVFKNLGNAFLAEQIGSLKEINDAGRGGSGFSFIDMAANKAGINLVQQLVNIDPQQVRQLSTEQFEQAFFPSISELPEGLSEEAFINQFGSLTDSRYIELENIIEQRLAKLTLFKMSEN